MSTCRITALAYYRSGDHFISSFINNSHIHSISTTIKHDHGAKAHDVAKAVGQIVIRKKMSFDFRSATDNKCRTKTSERHVPREKRKISEVKWTAMEILRLRHKGLKKKKRVEEVGQKKSEKENQIRLLESGQKS